MSSVDFPAPRNPQIMVKGTREGDSEMISVASVSILVESTTGQWCICRWRLRRFLVQVIRWHESCTFQVGLCKGAAARRLRSKAFGINHVTAINILPLGSLLQFYKHEPPSIRGGTEECCSRTCGRGVEARHKNSNDRLKWQLQFRYEMRRECQEILPGLLLGPFVASKSFETLTDLKVSHMYVVGSHLRNLWRRSDA